MELGQATLRKTLRQIQESSLEDIDEKIALLEAYLILLRAGRQLVQNRKPKSSRIEPPIPLGGLADGYASNGSPFEAEDDRVEDATPKPQKGPKGTSAQKRKSLPAPPPSLLKIRVALILKGQGPTNDKGILEILHTAKNGGETVSMYQLRKFLEHNNWFEYDQPCWALSRVGVEGLKEYQKAEGSE